MPRYFSSGRCALCGGELTLSTVAPTPEARRRHMCTSCRDLAIDQYLTSSGLTVPAKAAEGYELRESAADYLGLGRAAKWRYVSSTALPGVSAPDRQIALLRYITEMSATRFGLSDSPDDAEERCLLNEWKAPPQFKAFGLPAFQYGVCLVFPRSAGQCDPRGVVRCDMCRKVTMIAMPEFVPVPSRLGEWVLRWSWHGGPVTGICGACREMADAFEHMHRALGMERL